MDITSDSGAFDTSQNRVQLLLFNSLGSVFSQVYGMQIFFSLLTPKKRNESLFLDGWARLSV